jgi:hypothetical protein
MAPDCFAVYHCCHTIPGSASLTSITRAHAPLESYLDPTLCTSRVLRTICLVWTQTTIYLSSASEVTRITGMSYQHPASLFLQ